MAELFKRQDLIDMLRGTQIQLQEEELMGDAILRALEEKSDAEEMRTPKKVLVDNHDYLDGKKFITYGCPTCERIIWHEGPNYCSNCGQALDWTEVTE